MSIELFYHHIKIALRSLSKYRTQNIISIIGLAIGFTFFSFSALWIRYEMSYDGFHANAERIYRVNIAYNKWNTVETSATNQIAGNTPYTLSNWLKTNYPEIEEATGIRITRPANLSILYLDQNFCNIFELDLPNELFIPGRTDRPIAVTPDLNNAATVETIKVFTNMDVFIETTMPAWRSNTNMQFNTAIPITHRYTEAELNSWGAGAFHTFILVKNGVDVQNLKNKLDKVEIPFRPTPISLVLTSLKQLRHKDPTGNISSDIKFAHIQIFVVAGLLVILCSLFNHLTLYVTRVRMRLRELALRKVNGAENRQIIATLYIDFMFVILLSLATGFGLITWLLPIFKEYASIGNANASIYIELFIYAIMLIAFGFVICGITVLYFQRQVITESMKGGGKPGAGNIFRNSILLIQLIISIGMMFCATVFIKQIRFLHDTDLGMNRRNIGSVSITCCPLTPPFAEFMITEIPEIVDALPIMNFGAINYFRNMITGTQQRTYVKDGEIKSYAISMLPAFSNFLKFFEIEIIEGTRYYDYDPTSIYVVNESVMKEFGDAFLSGYIEPLSTRDFNPVGVCRDFFLTPTKKAVPTRIYFPHGLLDLFNAIAFRYEEGMREQTEQAITRWLRKEFSEWGEFGIEFTYMEDIYEEYFESERALLKLLSVMAFVCIMIAVFGVYSIANITSQQRRKEIAIRKVHGAEVLDIMNIFFKEYLILLSSAALVAFPAGYLIMKRWMEGYVKQTSIDVWIYVAIFLTVFVVIVFSILSTIWKAARQNPAEVVKSG